ncbi:MAG: hypothetical protein JXR72_02045, partial [Proteobacteria bacterium]|nr:hypothetical protein [Pseudomonadota bacterium]
SEDIKNAAAFRAIHLTGVKGVKLVNLVFAGLETPESGWPGVYIEKCEGVEVSDNFIFGYPRAMSVLSSARVVISGNRMERNSSGINLSASDFKISGNLIAGQPMLKTISRGIFVSGGGGEIVNNTIVYHKVEKNTFIGNMSANFGPDGSGISAVNGARVSLENNIVFENSAGIFLGPDCQGRVEFNDIFQNTMPTGGTGPVGIFGSTSFESYLTGSDWNISKGVQHRYEEAPLLSLSSWHHHYWGPSTIQLSQTNLMQDPFFNDPVRGDYRLAPDSPLIGRGRGGVHIGAYPPVAGGAGEGAFK